MSSFYPVDTSPGHVDRSGSDRKLSDYAWRWLIHHMIDAKNGEAIKKCFRAGFLNNKKKAGYAPDSLQIDFLRSLAFFKDKDEIANMILVAFSFYDLKGTPDLFKYESYLIWLGAVIAANDDRSQINQAITYIERQPSSSERLRMIAELLIGLGNHPLAIDLRNHHRKELEKMVVDAPEKSGLDLLAAEALGAIDQAFQFANLLGEKPSAQRLCRIMKLVRRHTNHTGAPSLLIRLLDMEKDYSYPMRRNVDAILAAFGLLQASTAEGEVLDYAIKKLRKIGLYTDSISALFIAIYLNDNPKHLFKILDPFTYNKGLAELYTRSILFMGWFDPLLKRYDLVNLILGAKTGESELKVKTTNGRLLKLIKILPPWESRILATHLDDFWLVQGTQNCPAHEAILVPVFLLWAKLLSLYARNQDNNIKILNDLDIKILSPEFEHFFSRDDYLFTEWIELGQALCCIENSDLSKTLLERFIDLLSEDNSTVILRSYYRKSVRSFLSYGLFFTFMWLEGAFFGLVLALLFIGFIGALFLGLFFITMPRQISTYGYWLTRKPASHPIIRMLEIQKAQGKDNSWWLEGTDIWQFVAINLLEAGREDLALYAIPKVLHPQDFIHQLQPSRWNRSGHLDSLIRMTRKYLQTKGVSEIEDWELLLKQLVTLWQSKAEYAIPPAGLKLARKGYLSVEGLILITRKFTPGGHVILANKDEIDMLGEVLQDIKNDEDFLAACQAINLIEVIEPGRLISWVLQSALLRTKASFAEVTYTIAKWNNIRDPQVLSEARKIYYSIAAPNKDLPLWLKSPALFTVVKLFHQSLSLAERKGLTKVAFQVPWLAMHYVRQRLTWKVIRDTSPKTTHPVINPFQ